MQKTYYIQSLKEATPALKEVTELVNEMGDAAAPIIELLVENLGFRMSKSEDGKIVLKIPKYHSVWGVRAYSKKLITLEDVWQYLQRWDCSGIDWEEEYLEEIVEAIAQDPEYPKHVHQSESLIARYVESWTDNYFEEHPEECEDDCRCCGGCHDDEKSDDPETPAEEKEKKEGTPATGLRIHLVF